ncbi:MAG: ATP-binding protein [Pseudobdellovibrionaceae bacterium]
MYRLANKSLTHWLQSIDRKPVVLRGARQVGKSTLVKLLAQANGFTLHEINLEKVFLQSTENEISIEKVISEVESISKNPVGKKSIIFFDEIKKQPSVYSALRYFREERPDIPVLAAGSLLEVYVEEFEHSVPVGRVQYYHLGPMNFFEFLHALGEKELLKKLSNYNPFDELPDRVHQQALDFFSIYLSVGGMPEAVKKYRDTGSFLSVAQVHESILQTYQDDFYKYATRTQVTKLQTLFRSLPSKIGQKIKWSEIDPTTKAFDLQRCYQLLVKSGVVLNCCHSNATSLSLEATLDEKTFKPYFLDVGLLSSRLQLNTSAFDLKADSPIKGTFYEQFIAQHLAFYRGPLVRPELSYWLRDKKKNLAEIDFIIEKKLQKFPIEVKDQPLGKMQSLKLFCNQHKTKTAINFCLKKPKKEKINNTEVLCIPIYAVQYLKKYLLD